jgi:hypothetical protein
MLMAGVVPPLETTGAVPVTDVTVPTDTEPPKLIAEPLIVIALFVNPLFGIVALIWLGAILMSVSAKAVNWP